MVITLLTRDTKHRLSSPPLNPIIIWLDFYDQLIKGYQYAWICIRNEGKLQNSTLGGTRGRTRTGTLFLAGDFESPVSTNFTTLA